MSTYQITGVRLVTPPGYTHSHISHVRIGTTSTAIISRETVVSDLRSINGDRYITYAGGVRADVIVRSCPGCGYRDYITTTPDYTTTNNLLSLPRI